MIEATPQMTGTEHSGRQLAPQSPSSGRQVEAWTGHPALKPADRDQFRTELTACLALAAPAGFDESARSEWLRAAWATLTGIPADLLTRGCKAARARCDHPSKIVPTIMLEVEAAWDARRGAWGKKPEDAPKPESKRDPEPEYVTPEQMEAIKAEFGLVTNPYPDKPKPARHLRQPTAEDLAEVAKDMGIPISTGRTGNVPPIQGLSIAEIFAQRDARRVVAFAPSASDDEDWERHCA